MVSSVDKKPTIHIHKETGLRFLRGTEQVLFENGVTVPRSEFDWYKDNNLLEVINKYAKILNNCNYDFAYACSTGELRRARGKAHLYRKKPVVKQKKEVINLVEVIQETTQEAPINIPEPPPEAQKQLLFSSALLIMVVMGVVGIGSAVMSAYHTSTFLIEGGKPVWTGLLTGIMLILFSGTAFTAARYFFKEGGVLNFFGILFIVAGFAVIGYSMFATLTVNFDQFRLRSDEKTAVVVEDSETLNMINRLVQQNEEELNEVNLLISRLEGEADYWRSMSWRRYDEIQEQINEATTQRSSLRLERAEMESSKPELVSAAESSQETIYTFLGRLLKLEEDIARFFVYVIPACLYDILAPFALSVVLFLVDKRRRLYVSV
jgi:hypothetical protein